MRAYATFGVLATAVLVWTIASAQVGSPTATPPTRVGSATAPPLDDTWVAQPGEPVSADVGCSPGPAIAAPYTSEPSD